MKHKCDGCKYKGEHREMMFRPFGVCTKETNLIEAEKAYNAENAPGQSPRPTQTAFVLWRMKNWRCFLRMKFLTEIALIANLIVRHPLGINFFRVAITHFTNGYKNLLI